MNIIINNLTKEILSDSDYGKILKLTNFLSRRNTLEYNNGKALSKNMLYKYLGFNNIRSLGNFINKIRNVLLFHNNIFYVNPYIITNNNFEWYKDIFDIFSFYKEATNLDFEYIKIKSKWYNISHEICIKDIKDMVSNISGIYRLYKNNQIVYVGKSICIKKRLTQHAKEKDIDSFDFTILNNESDKNIYELYYIDKYKPLYNNDCVENSRTNIELKNCVFSDMIKINSTPPETNP